MDKNNNKPIGCEITHQFFAQKQVNKASVRKKEIVAKTEQAARKSFADFADFVYRARGGWTDENEVKHDGVNFSTDDAMKEFYGAESTFEFLQLFGVNPETDTLQSMARKITGKRNFELKPGDVLDMMASQSSHTMYTKRSDYGPEYNFLLPQVILDAIYLGYVNSGMHLNWIIRTQSTNGQDSATFPYIIMGNGSVGKTAEGADAKMTTIEIGQKKPKTEKLTGGIKMTYEVLRGTTLINLADALSYVGEQMAMKADAMALKVLISGDMADGSESAPVVGVNTTGAFTGKDIKRVIAQMTRLMYNSSRMISGLETGLNIDDLPEFKGFSGETKQFRFPPLGVPDNFTREIFTMPSDNQVLLLDPARAMVKLQETGVLIEQDKNIVNQTVIGVVSMSVGFGIARRNARILLDNTVDFDTAGFPTYMDVDALVAEYYQD